MKYRGVGKTLKSQECPSEIRSIKWPVPIRLNMPDRTGCVPGHGTTRACAKRVFRVKIMVFRQNIQQQTCREFRGEHFILLCEKNSSTNKKVMACWKTVKYVEKKRWKKDVPTNQRIESTTIRSGLVDLIYNFCRKNCSKVNLSREN